MADHVVLRKLRVHVRADGAVVFNHRENSLPPADPYWWLSILDIARAKMDVVKEPSIPEGERQVATLGQIHVDPHWMWAYCKDGFFCRHRAPIAIAPFVIRWGADASSDLIRQRFRCSKCGKVGADLIMPSWSQNSIKWAAFPVEELRSG